MTVHRVCPSFTSIRPALPPRTSSVRIWHYVGPSFASRNSSEPKNLEPKGEEARKTGRTRSVLGLFSSPFQERATLYAINKTFSTQQKRDTIPAGCWYEVEKLFLPLRFASIPVHAQCSRYTAHLHFVDVRIRCRLSAHC